MIRDALASDATKRAFDITVAVAALVVLAPVLAVAAVLIRLETPGPVFFRQRRVGMRGEPFEMIKLRTMVADAAALGGYSTEPGDPRITRTGAFLRRTSLDEIPQLFNVLRGEMSIVGPRPCVPAQQSEFRPDDWERRHHVRPGVTGLAQVNGRSAATFDQKLSHDLEYVDRRGLREDLQICLLTVRQLASGQGN